VGRDIFLFLDKEQHSLYSAMGVLTPNVTVERDLLLRPRDRKPFLVRATITRKADDRTLWWTFSRLSPGSIGDTRRHQIR